MIQENDQQHIQDQESTEDQENGMTETDSLAQEIATLQEEIARLKDQLLRTLAEVENTRKRAQKDMEETAKYAHTGFAKDMVGVSDNLRRALSSLPKDMDKADALIKGVIEGVVMTEKQLIGALEKHGIQEVPALGEKFDHNFHQAVFEVEDTDKPAGTVTNVMEAGYTINGRLLRPAMVGVSKKA